MARFNIALNMEFCRPADKSSEAGVEIAAGLYPFAPDLVAIRPAVSCGQRSLLL